MDYLAGASGLGRLEQSPVTLATSRSARRSLNPVRSRRWAGLVLPGVAALTEK